MDAFHAQPAGRNQDTLQEAHLPADRWTTDGSASKTTEPCLHFVAALFICIEQLTLNVEVFIFRSQPRSSEKTPSIQQPW